LTVINRATLTTKMLAENKPVSSSPPNPELISDD
jgi:hypothetical protein